MSKPTIFFSHSSKDQSLILSIKDKLERATSSVVDIFVSSDGQSIPFGTNWVHKIEERLKAAQIMFVFVTENSISSGWIYFEAGFAYSKDIQVVPVGIGVDVGALKAPLNLLQGFNVNSEESLNNFITIINRKFGYDFKECFNQEDYLRVMKNLSNALMNTINFEEIVDKAECTIYSKYTVSDVEETYDIEGFFNSIIAYLKENDISFSRECEYPDKRSICLVTNGVKIVYRRKNSAEGIKHETYDDCEEIRFNVSAYNFFKSFTLLKNLLQLLEDKKSFYIKLHFKECYSCVKTAEDGSSIISDCHDFKIDKSNVTGYESDLYGLRFYVFDDNKYERDKKSEYVISVVFDKDSVYAENVVKLVDVLYDIGFIYRK